MSNLKTIPASDLKNNFDEVVKAVHESSRPVILTENGSEDIILMGHHAYQQFILDMEIYFKVKEAEEEEERNGKMYTMEECLQSAYAAINGESHV